MAQKPCPENLGDQQEESCTVFFCRTYIMGQNAQDTIRITGSTWNYHGLLSLTCVSVSMYVLVLATFGVSKYSFYQKSEDIFRK